MSTGGEAGRRRIPRPAHSYEKRSFVLRRKDTTIAMERFYWTALEGIAKQQGVGWRWLVRAILERRPGDYASRSGWLRFYITAYFILGARKDVPLIMAFMPEEGWS